MPSWLFPTLVGIALLYELLLAVQPNWSQRLKDFYRKPHPGSLLTRIRTALGSIVGLPLFVLIFIAYAVLFFRLFAGEIDQFLATLAVLAVSLLMTLVAPFVARHKLTGLLLESESPASQNDHIVRQELEESLTKRDLEGLVKCVERYGSDLVGNLLLDICRTSTARAQQVLDIFLNSLEGSPLAGRNLPRLRFYLYSRLVALDLTAGDQILKRAGLAEGSYSLGSHWHRKDKLNARIERAADVIFSVLVLSIFTFVIPVIPVIVALLLIRRSPSQTVFFVSERVGIGGTSFRLYQFRAQRYDQKNRRHQTGPLGGALLWSCMDRLPALVNVIRGEMSLVGPHPMYLGYIAALLLMFEEKRDWIKDLLDKRLSVRPGLFGYAQLDALCSGDTRTCADHLRMDAKYAEEGLALADYFKMVALAAFLWISFFVPNALANLISPRRMPPLRKPRVPLLSILCKTPAP